jgi:hypothetical protein
MIEKIRAAYGAGRIQIVNRWICRHFQPFNQ